MKWTTWKSKNAQATNAVDCYLKATVVLFAIVVFCASPISSAAERWVGTWASGQQLTEPRNNPPAPGLSNNTLRQEIQTTLGGGRMRVEISNKYGTGPVIVEAAHVAMSKGGGVIEPATDAALCFDGERSVTIPAGEAVYSDALDYVLEPLTRYAVTMYFGETSAAVTGHPGSRTTSYIQPGDTVRAADMSAGAKTEHWYNLGGIDLLLDDSYGCVVTLGDSITDGRGSTTNGNNRWPDNLARRLLANPATAKVGVLNMGIGGNAVVRGGLGPVARERFDHDVLEQDGVRWVLVLEGINDIGGSQGMAVADGLIGEYKVMVEKARAKGVKIYGVTILPFVTSFYDRGVREEARQKVNAWIREAGNFDAVVDLDAAVRDPENPAVLLPEYDDGDHLHLSPAGYQAMADAIDLGLFE